jgi:hypothetical protein
MIQEIGESLVNPLVGLWDGFVNVLPGLVGAIVVLLIGYIIAALIASALLRVFQKVHLDKWLLEKTKIRKLVGGLKLSQFLAVIVKWYMFILFLPPAASLIKLDSLSAFLNQVAVWVPNAIIALIVVLVGLMVAGYVAEQIIDTKSKSARIIADVAKVIIMIVVVLVALEQIGIRVALVQNVVLLIVAGIVTGIALGVGIAFGLGGKDEAAKIVEQVKKKF